MYDRHNGQTSLQIALCPAHHGMSLADLADGSWDQNSGHSPAPLRSPPGHTLQHSPPARPFHERLQSLII